MQTYESDFFFFFLCHTNVKRTVIYFGISVILGILEIFAVSQGIVGIRGVFSNKFLAMSKKGKLHASVSKPPAYQYVLFIKGLVTSSRARGSDAPRQGPGVPSPFGCWEGSVLGGISTLQTDRGQVEPKTLKPVSLLTAFNQEKCLFFFFFLQLGVCIKRTCSLSIAGLFLATSAADHADGFSQMSPRERHAWRREPMCLRGRGCSPGILAGFAHGGETSPVRVCGCTQGFGQVRSSLCGSIAARVGKSQ